MSARLIVHQLDRLAGRMPPDDVRQEHEQLVEALKAELGLTEPPPCIPPLPPLTATTTKLKELK